MSKPIIFIAILLGLIGLSLAVFDGSSKPSTLSQPKKSYVALGDSVAAGVGLEKYSDSSACDRTYEAYPNLVATTLNLKLANLACSGATLPNGILGPLNVNDLLLKSQLDQTFSRPKPSLITITIGANDIDWTGLISKCYSSVCGTDSDTVAVNDNLSKVSTNLSAALTLIQQHYKTNIPHVIVTSYHQVFPTGSLNCSDLNGIDSTELSWGRDQQSNLNSTIEMAVAPFMFAKVAVVNFTNHELCTPDSWVQGLGSSDPYHPSDEGQAAYAKQVEQTTKLFK